MVPELLQQRKAVYPGFVTVREVKIQSIAADNGDMLKRKVRRDVLILQCFLSGPLVDAPGAGARTTQLGSVVTRLGIIRPFDRKFRIAFLNYLKGFDHDDYEAATEENGAARWASMSSWVMS